MFQTAEISFCQIQVQFLMILLLKGRSHEFDSDSRRSHKIEIERGWFHEIETDWGSLKRCNRARDRLRGFASKNNLRCFCSWRLQNLHSFACRLSAANKNRPVAAGCPIRISVLCLLKFAERIIEANFLSPIIRPREPFSFFLHCIDLFELACQLNRQWICF